VRPRLQPAAVTRRAGPVLVGLALGLLALGLWPGFAILRDARQFIAPLALAEAVGLGLAVSWGMQPGSFGTKKTTERPGGKHRTPAPSDLQGLVLGAFALLAPVLLLPWAADRAGLEPRPDHARRLAPGWWRARSPGTTGPRSATSPWPRTTRARRPDGLVASARPLTAALRAAGVRFVVVDGGLPGARDPRDARDTRTAARLGGCTTPYYGPDLVVYQIPR
jgi:hypothetical protein